MANIMIAEDDPSLLDLYREILEDLAGHTVVASVRDGGEFMKNYLSLREKGVPVHLLIIDHMIPVKDGLELISEVRDVDKEVRILFISGIDDVQGRAIKTGADSFIPKPFDMSLFIAEIKKLLSDS